MEIKCVWPLYMVFLKIFPKIKSLLFFFRLCILIMLIQ